MAEPDEPKQPGEEPLPDDPKPAAAPRRSGWRRLGRVVLGVLIALVLVLVLGLVFIHTGPGRSAVQAFVEKTGGAAAGGELRFGSLDYRLWGGWLNAGRVHLTMEGTELDIGEAQVRWSPRGGVRLRIVRPNVVLRDSGKPKPVQHAVGIAARPWTALERVAQAELIDARIEMQDANGVAYLVLGDVDASLQERDGRRPIRLTVNDGVVGPPQRQLRPITGTGALTIEKGQLQFNAVHLDARGSTVDLEGSLDRLSPNEGALKLRADADGALAALVAPETEVKGRLRAQANLVAKDTMSGTLRLSSPDLAVQGIGPWDASLRGRFDSSHLVIEWGEALGYGGRFTVDGPVALADASKTDLNLRAENVDVAALGAAVAQTAVPIRSRMSASLRYTLSGWDVNQGRAEGEILLAPVPALPPRRRGGVPGVPVKGSSKVSVEGRRVRLSDLRVEAHNALVVGDVAVSPALDIQGRYRAELPLGSLGALFADMGMQPPASPLAGTLRAQGELGGKAKDPVATLRLQGEGIRTAEGARQATASLDGKARYARGRLAIAPLVVRSSGGGQATFNGSVPVIAKGGSYDLDGVVESLDLGPMLAIAGIDGRGPLNGRVRVEGPQARPSARAFLSARLALAGSPEPIELSLAGGGSGTRMALERFDAALAGGRVHGAFAYDSRTRALEGSATLEALRLARLPLLPPSAKGLDGLLAGSFSLSGTSEAPVGELRASLDQATVQGSPIPGLLLTGRSDGQRLALSGGTLSAAQAGGGTTQATAVQPGSAPAEARATFLRGSGSLEGDWLVRIEIDAAALPLQELLAGVPRRARAAGDGAGRGPAGDRRAAARPGQAALQRRGPARERAGARAAVEHADVHGVGRRRGGERPRAAARDDQQGAGLARAHGGAARGRRGEPGPARQCPPARGRGRHARDRRPHPDRRGPPLRPHAARRARPRAAARARARELGRRARPRLDVRVAGTVADPDLRGQLELVDGRGRFGTVRVNRFDALVALEGERATIRRFEARALGGRITAAGSGPCAA